MRERAQIKEIAKFQFNQRYGMSIGAALLFILLAAGDSRVQYGVHHNANFPIDINWLPFLHIISVVATILFLVYILVGAPLRVGYAHFCRCTYNNWTTSVGDMFRRAFGDYARHLGGMLWMDLFILLWSMLLVIPGIVKSYAYFAAPYILAEFPAVRATDAIRISMRMTNGFKAEIFVLDLSFIGWHLLSALTFGLLGIFYVNPYYYTSRAGMYEELKQNAINTGTVNYWELMGQPASPSGV